LPPLVSLADGQRLNVSTEPAVICLPARIIEKMKTEVVNLRAEDKKAQAEIKQATLPSGLRTYKTKEGDSLMSLAEKFYGNKYDWMKIYQANKDNIEKGALKTGQTLIIP